MGLLQPHERHGGRDGGAALTPAPPTTARLDFARFTDTDAPGLAEVLSDPEITRSITAKATTPELCLAAAKYRIAWHNGTWESRAYGVWAVRPSGEDRVIGWCGLVEPDVGTDPEILYGFVREVWGQGLATEAAQSTIAWAFENDVAQGVSAIIFGRLNPGSVAVTAKLGMTRRGTMAFSDFLSSPEMGRDVLDYEIWRIEHGACLDTQDMLFQAPYKSGQIVSTGAADPEPTLRRLIGAALARPDLASSHSDGIRTAVTYAFEMGMSEPEIDWYHIARGAWPPGDMPKR